MALTSFATWFSSSPSAEVESDSTASSSADEHATSSHLPVSDENRPPSRRIQFALTTTEVKQRPRAWQRKPATPFAPRSESQKIWKRVPLQNVASNVNAAWERGGKSGDGIMRPVKKLRVADLTGDNKENISSAISKWDPETSPVKTPHRRKTRPCTDLRIHDLGTQTDVELGQDSSSDNDLVNEDLIFGEEAVQSLWSDCHQDEVSSCPDESSDGLHSSHKEFLSETVQAISMQSVHGPHAHTSPVPRTMLDDANNEFVAPATNSGHVDSALVRASDAEEANISTDNLGIEVNKRTPSEKPESKDEPVGTAANPNSDSSDNFLSQYKHFVPDDHNDTSYLQAFLCRSRAQRQGKPQAVQVCSPTPTNVALVPAGLQLPSNSPVQEVTTNNVPPSESLSLPVETTNREDEHDNQDDADAQASSPCRRSSRITRLPRPQRPVALLNTISLRRLNGNEFIPMQKESQSLAISTRANTKRNKGSAINVRQRLPQLQAEKHPSVTDDRLRVGKCVEWSKVVARMQGEDGSEVNYVPERKLGDGLEAAQFEQRVAVLEDSKTEPEPESKPVRKRRKESLGNANGTPAPKKTIELLLENASSQASGEEEQIDGPRPTPIKRPRTKTSPQI